jgi:cell division protein FtsB
MVQWSLSLRLGTRFWLLWIGVISLFFIWSWMGDYGFPSAGKLREQRLSLEKENQILRQSNDRLKSEIRLVQQDPSFLEWIAKERLGMIGENERLYIFQQ